MHTGPSRHCHTASAQCTHAPVATATPHCQCTKPVPVHSAHRSQSPLAHGQCTVVPAATTTASAQCTVPVPLQRTQAPVATATLPVHGGPLALADDEAQPACCSATCVSVQRDAVQRGLQCNVSQCNVLQCNCITLIGGQVPSRIASSSCKG